MEENKPKVIIHQCYICDAKTYEGDSYIKDSIGEYICDSCAQHYLSATTSIPKMILENSMTAPRCAITALIDTMILALWNTIRLKGEWNGNYQVFLKIEGCHEWRSASNVAAEYGMSLPATYRTAEKAIEAARKMKAAWGFAKVVKERKAKEPTKKELAAMTVEQFVELQKTQAAKAAA